MEPSQSLLLLIFICIFRIYITSLLFVSLFHVTRIYLLSRAHAHTFIWQVLIYWINHLIIYISSYFFPHFPHMPAYSLPAIYLRIALNSTNAMPREAPVPFFRINRMSLGIRRQDVLPHVIFSNVERARVSLRCCRAIEICSRSLLWMSYRRDHAQSPNSLWSSSQLRSRSSHFPLRSLSLSCLERFLYLFLSLSFFTESLSRCHPQRSSRSL